MSKQPKTVNLGNRQAILVEINALLETSGAINEARAKAVRKALDALRDANSVPATEEDSLEEDIQLDAKIDIGLETLRARIHKQVERRKRDHEKALRLMDEIETALKANKLQEAERANNRLLSLLGNVPGRSDARWQDIEKRLQQVRPQLRKLESWRHWGTTQARENLIDQVRQLIDTEMHPEKLAQQIKQAREQWHDWDKSGDHAGKALWKTFDQACEAAYKPCSAHFKQLKQQRAENLRQRQAIIDALSARLAATDWKQPDWRDIDKFVRHARRDFYRIGNVDFSHRKPVARALDAVLEKFEEHLSRERSRSGRAREKLIADIEALGEVASLQDALGQLEALKKQWKITVTGKRDHENRLWKHFQSACDITYRRRDAERNEQATERNENMRQKQALIEELARVTAAGDEELLANASILARIQGRWDETGGVPREQEKSLNSHWQNAQKRFRSELKAAQTRARASALDNLAHRAALCNQWEQEILAGNAPDSAAVTSTWDALPVLSDAGAEAINQRFKQSLSRPDDGTLANNLAVKQAACLRLEVLLELESPAEFQAERMAYQIERLNASMQKQQGTQASPADLLQTALTTGAVPAEAAGMVEHRITECLTRYKHQAE
ncbi:MAG: DUF349 domain-containing protein [Gammaproteobacteria bacterium]